MDPTNEKCFEFLFETKEQFLSFMEQELLMLELRYKQHAGDFNRITAFQIKTGFNRITALAKSGGKACNSLCLVLKALYLEML